MSVPKILQGIAFEQRKSEKVDALGLNEMRVNLKNQIKNVYGWQWNDIYKR